MYSPQLLGVLLVTVSLMSTSISGAKPRLAVTCDVQAGGPTRKLTCRDKQSFKYRVPTVSVNGGCSTTDDFVCCPDNIKIEKLKKDDCTPAT
ncbi:hypothetical protein MJO28_015110 [Puccinia striiformis f. sp. tritici]|uniref:Uncharacterized protein n=2 Tax=Puccinia striiformis TaxID=27350 RepID=A0A2S4UCI0_9BASI|nr:hypothetical protein Pst134EA_027953 [Puccinia striiformis f. sp. tritici]KAI9616092.1 hypothetical protein KEM48_005349 [Puccinia striiformis f. sp. tritici PST-130]POV94979.1 hypothetical protein PSTT_16542 [Puccinia striiformis]KAH9448656.1 hypothetical protein Pst134EA_027953 [Puccinia striiformis f. sp. tritici]KAI7937564.1 hypothetical protein MJO29_014879 [Puccinia striiformis f. sp. tritici]KAI7938190.1 hypothetical protein MJO28_015110 [Puccinia striiformis f. sp. tritici]